MAGIGPEENQQCLARHLPQERLLQVFQAKQGWTSSDRSGRMASTGKDDSAQFRGLTSSTLFEFLICLYCNFQNSILSQSLPSL